MPVECGGCRIVLDEGRLCPQCGKPMRYTLLGSVQADDDQDMITEKVSAASRVTQRIGQWLLAMVWLHVFAYCLLAACIIGLSIAGMNAADPGSDDRVWLEGALSACLLVSVALSVFMTLRKTYLAQIMGAVIGLTGALLILAERQAIGLFPPAMHDWLMLSPLALAVGFGCGLLIAGKYEAKPTFRFKPIDAWDRKTKAKAVEYNPPAGLRWQRLGLGILIGLLAVYGLEWLLGKIVAPVYRNNPRLIAVAVEQADTPIRLLALFLAGMMAGSSTRSGASQGFLAGLALFGLYYLWSPPANADALVLMLLMTIAVPTVGGIIGRIIFRPMRLYSGSLDGSANFGAAIPQPKPARTR